MRYQIRGQGRVAFAIVTLGYVASQGYMQKLIMRTPRKLLMLVLFAWTNRGLFSYVPGRHNG